MAISAVMVKELRERTGLGMILQKGLVEADGDMDKAIEDLRKEFFESGQKRAAQQPMACWRLRLLKTAPVWQWLK